MPLVPQPRDSEILRVKQRPLEFSFWPVEKTTRRYGLGSRVFATDPWTVIRRSAERRCLAASREATFALLEQAEDFYRAAESGVKAAKPLLLYYCFMNLAKAFVLTCRQRNDVDNAHHGLSEKLDPAPNDKELVNAYLTAERTGTNAKLKNFDELMRAISGTGFGAGAHRFDLPTLLAQVVPGHRLCVQAVEFRERFVSLERIEFRHNKLNRQIWIRLYIFKDDLQRINMTHQELLDSSRLSVKFKEVATGDQIDERQLICLDQDTPVAYTGRPSDSIPEVVREVRHLLWRTVLIVPLACPHFVYQVL